jgi:hypothetical protein
MSDYDALWRSLVDGDPARSTTHGERSRPESHSASAVRIIDATILVIRAMRNLAEVTEGVLLEQRDRIDRAGRSSGPDNTHSASENESIDLSY